MGLSYVFIVCVFNNFHLHSIVTMVTFVKCDANCSTWEIYSMALYRQDLSTYGKVATIAPIWYISQSKNKALHAGTEFDAWCSIQQHHDKSPT